jgi:NADH-quinone oxidoreductase subunit L
MLHLLWLVPILPFTAFIILVLIGRRLSKRAIASIGVGFTTASTAIALLITYSFISSPPPGCSFIQTLWNWILVDAFAAGISFNLDSVSLVFTLVITFVGSLILLYSSEYMQDEEGYSRFFAYMNLFIGSMLCLVLADNLLFLYLGWEGVGLCSYLLIGFWYRDPANGLAARKAFIVTRIGDTALAIGLFFLYNRTGTLQIAEMLNRISIQWSPGDSAALAASLLLLGGAVGKSAQLPLQTWLPDAMAGPTPVSALIHAATMVTAGVYLIARTHTIFELSPAGMTITAAIGALTLIISSFSGLVQKDIKRVLAYSTMSQIGYMFLALGTGAWAYGIFHFLTHAFFKALLFLGAGVVILAMHHEQNMFMMGGLRKQLPVTFWTFLIGSGALSAIPFVTSGFYSKDSIIWYSWSGVNGGLWLFAAALAGSFLTSLYTFRMVFITFFGKAHHPIAYKPGLRLQAPLAALAFFSLTAGFLNMPEIISHFSPFARFLEHTLPRVQIRPGTAEQEWAVGGIAIAVSLSGVYLAYLFFLRRPQMVSYFARGSLGKAIRRFLFAGWAFDRLYENLLIRPYVWISNINKNDFIDIFYDGLAWLAQWSYMKLSASETGRVRLYATLSAVGAIIAIALAVLL